MKVFIDSSAFLAIADTDDGHHEHGRLIFQDILTKGAKLFSSNYILDETYTLIRARTNHQTVVNFIKSFELSGITVLRVSPQIEDLAKRIFIKYSDKNFSFTDCTSFVLINENKIDATFAYDVHFRQYRYKHTVTYLTAIG